MTGCPLLLGSICQNPFSTHVSLCEFYNSSEVLHCWQALVRALPCGSAGTSQSHLFSSGPFHVALPHPLDFYDPAVLNNVSLPHRTHIFLPPSLCICRPAMWIAHPFSPQPDSEVVQTSTPWPLRMWSSSLCSVFTWLPVLPFHSTHHTI